jgi:thiamine kinase
MPEVASAAALEQAERDVRAALHTDAVTAGLAEAALRPVVGGLSNYAWQASTGAGVTCFVRLARPLGDLLGADHANECRLLAVTSRAGLSPEVVRCDPRRRLLVTRWVDAPEPGKVAGRETEIAAVAHALARLHDLPAPGDSRVVDFEAQAQQLGHGVDGIVHGLDLRTHAAEVFQALREARPARTLCHNDLNPWNLLFAADDRVWLVDWEYAGLGAPAFDLASFASQHGLDEPQRETLVRRYREAGGSIAAGCLEHALWAFDYVQWLWYRAALHRPESPAGQPDLLAARASGLADSLRARARGVLRCNNARFED